MKLPPGMTDRMREDDYHACEAVSKSHLDLINRSPAHYACAEARKPTRNMQIGTAIHRAILEPQRFSSDYVDTGAADRRASEYKQAANSVGGELALTAAEYANCIAMRDAVHSHPAARDILALEYATEVSAFGVNPEHGCEVRCRYDLLAWDHLVGADLKKCQDARPDVFARSVVTYRYHVQAAWYCDVFEWITGQRLDQFAFIVVEEQPPHNVMVYVLDDEALEIGRFEYRKNLGQLIKCRERNEWPGYSNEPETLSLPTWRVAKYEDELEVQL